jgi:hypothetical protein
LEAKSLQIPSASYLHVISHLYKTADNVLKHGVAQSKSLYSLAGNDINKNIRPGFEPGTQSPFTTSLGSMQK